MAVGCWFLHMHIHWCHLLVLTLNVDSHVSMNELSQIAQHRENVCGIQFQLENHTAFSKETVHMFSCEVSKCESTLTYQ